jgi:hypothetical protein
MEEKSLVLDSKRASEALLGCHPELTQFGYGSKIVAYTQSNYGLEIITWEVYIPKWMVAEFNTHKMEIERNSASTRAVPTTLIIDMVRDYPALPLEWMYNTKGMAAHELMTPEDTEYANKVWLESRDLMIEQVKKLQNLPSGRSADKQRAGRLLEFCMGTVVVCTMTAGGKIGMNNFFGLRDNSGAQPEFRYVANMMHEQYHTSIPVQSNWHLPYITSNDVVVGDTYNEVQITKAIISSARCGRVTHYRQGLVYSQEEDIARGQSFANSGHFSPLRHAARAGLPQFYGNMYGWISASKLLMEHDYVTECCKRASLSRD